MNRLRLCRQWLICTRKGLFKLQAGLRSGDEVVVEALDGRELRVRRDRRFESAFGALTGVYSKDYLARLDAEDVER